MKLTRRSMVKGLLTFPFLEMGWGGWRLWLKPKKQEYVLGYPVTRVNVAHISDPEMVKFEYKFKEIVTIAKGVQFLHASLRMLAFDGSKFTVNFSVGYDPDPKYDEEYMVNHFFENAGERNTKDVKRINIVSDNREILFLHFIDSKQDV